MSPNPTVVICANFPVNQDGPVSAVPGPGAGVWLGAVVARSARAERGARSPRPLSGIELPSGRNRGNSPGSDRRVTLCRLAASVILRPFQPLPILRPRHQAKLRPPDPAPQIPGRLG